MDRPRAPRQRHEARASGALFRCTRGAHLVEYILLVGLLAVAAMAGVQVYQKSLTAKVEAQAECIRNLGGDCEGKAGAADGAQPTPPPEKKEAAKKGEAPKDEAAERKQLAKDITKKGGSGTDSDVDLVVDELAKLPKHVLQKLKDQGTKVVVARGSVTDYLADLKGVKPRGWPPGSSWDNVPGLYRPGSDEVVIAVVGHDTKGGAHIPKTGEGHGSHNLVIHETFHAVDKGGKQSSTDAFKTAREADKDALSAYQKQEGNAGLEETYAESAAHYYGGNAKYKDTHPRLHKYWSNDPLKPKK